MKRGNGPHPLKLILALVVTGIILFGASINDPFHFDDSLFLNDSNVTNPAGWPHFFHPLFLRQLTYLSFYLNYQLGETDPTLYHLANIALHIANSVLLFALLRRILDWRIASIAAWIFLAHPIQTESVLYVYQRSTLLACFFSLLALIALQARYRWLSLLMFGLAFESKEAALAVPLLLVAWYRLPFSEIPAEPFNEPNRQTRWYVLALAAVGVGLGAAALALLWQAGETTVGFGVFDAVTPLSYFLTQTRVVYTYMRLLFVPYPQSLEYDFELTTSLDIPLILRLAGLSAILATAVLLARSGRWRVQGLSILTFFALLAPTSSLIPSADLAFEHRLYLPMLAFSVGVASCLALLKRPLLLALPLVTVLSILTLQRGAVWGADTTLWEDTAKRVPRKARVWFNLGGAHLQSNPERAKTAFRRALELQPRFPEAFYNLGVIEQSGGRFREAISLYRQALALDSNYWPAWNNLGNSLYSIGESDRAQEAFETTLRLNPDYWSSQYNLAIVHYTAGRFDKAIPRLRSVLEWRPDFRDARSLLAVSLEMTGQREEAERERQRLGRLAGDGTMPATISEPAR